MNEEMKQPTTPDSTNNPAQGPLCSSVLLDGACENTDKEIWRKKEGDYYSASILVTKTGDVGIDVGGHVIVMSVEKWHALGRLRCALDDVCRPV